MKSRKSRDTTDELTESEKLMLDKACALVRTSEQKHKPMLDRWLSMMNKKIHQAGATWSLIGASMAIKHGYQEKFGSFIPKEEPVNNWTIE